MTDDEQYTRTKGETYVVMENPTRNSIYDPVISDYGWKPFYGRWRPRYYRRNYWRPYYGPRRWDGYEVPRGISFKEPHSPSWDRLKLVIITIVATPIVVTELAVLLEILRPQ